MKIFFLYYIFHPIRNCIFVDCHNLCIRNTHLKEYIFPFKVLTFLCQIPRKIKEIPQIFPITIHITIGYFLVYLYIQGSSIHKCLDLPFHLPVSPGNHVLYDVIGTGINPVGMRKCIDI